MWPKHCYKATLVISVEARCFCEPNSGQNSGLNSATACFTEKFRLEKLKNNQDRMQQNEIDGTNITFSKIHQLHRLESYQRSRQQWNTWRILVWFWNFFQTNRNSSKVLTFWPIWPHCGVLSIIIHTFFFHFLTASKESLSVVENPTTQAWAPR